MDKALARSRSTLTFVCVGDAARAWLCRSPPSPTSQRLRTYPASRRRAANQVFATQARALLTCARTSDAASRASSHPAGGRDSERASCRVSEEIIRNVDCDDRWKLWFIEGIDVFTMMYGLINYAHNLLEAPPPPDDARRRALGAWSWWTGADDDAGGDGDGVGDDGAPWDAALRIYFVAFVVNVVCFGALASRMLVHVVEGREFALGDGYYRFVATFTCVLDGVTDLPVWLASLVTRAYVGNLALTANIVVNLLACVRAVYITLTAVLEERAAVETSAKGDERAALADGGVINPVAAGDEDDGGDGGEAARRGGARRHEGYGAVQQRPGGNDAPATEAAARFDDGDVALFAPAVFSAPAVGELSAPSAKGPFRGGARS